MTDNKQVEKIYHRAIQLFKEGITGDKLVQESGKVETPIPIVGATLQIEGWFVGITIEKHITGFLQLAANSQLIRYSTFQRRPGSIEGCPSAEFWLDKATITNKVRTLAVAGETLTQPVLSYDRSPSRLAWLVKAVNPEGQVRAIYVTGDYVYVGSDSDDSTIGGSF